jgi:putative ABC transport system substrate-binding protein
MRVNASKFAITRRAFAATALAPLVSTPLAAQPRSSVRRIGWLTRLQPEILAIFQPAFHEGLAELGLRVGQDLEVEYRFANDDISQVPTLAADLVRSGIVALIAQTTTLPIVRRLNLPVPIIYLVSADPVSAGLADSLTRPRGNMTGLTLMAAELNSKRIELLHKAVPTLRRVALMGDPDHPGEHLERAATESAGQRLGVSILYRPTRTHTELAGALTAIRTDTPQGISLLADGFSLQHRAHIFAAAGELGLPVVSGWRTFAESGALLTYGPKLAAVSRRLAYYVDRILKGARPADLPIERPSEFELILNARTAQRLNIEFPAELLAQAAEVIE